MDTYNNRNKDNINYEQKIKKNFCLAIIPARGGSKGIKKKNIKLLNNKPLVAYSIEDAQSSNKVNDVIVSSDSKEILEISSKYGAIPILRPSELANDIIHGEPAMIHALLEFLKTNDFLPECTLLLQPTSPIRDIKDINAAIDNIFSGKFNSSISGTKTHNFIWEKDKNSNWTPPYGNKRPRRQEFHQITETGSFYAMNTLEFLQLGDRLIKPVNIIETSQISSYEIDHLFEWEILEALMRFNK